MREVEKLAKENVRKLEKIVRSYNELVPAIEETSPSELVLEQAGKIGRLDPP